MCAKAEKCCHSSWMNDFFSSFVLLFSVSHFHHIHEKENLYFIDPKFSKWFFTLFDCFFPHRCFINCTTLKLRGIASKLSRKAHLKFHFGLRRLASRSQLGTKKAGKMDSTRRTYLMFSRKSLFTLHFHHFVEFILRIAPYRVNTRQLYMKVTTYCTLQRTKT